MSQILVCILAQMRATRLCWPSFEKHVLRSLNADLALCIGTDESSDFSNPFWKNAKYKWCFPEPKEWGGIFDETQKTLLLNSESVPDWRILLKVPKLWLGGTGGPDNQPTRCAALYFFRWMLRQKISDEGLVGKYDRFVITRSDFVWKCPHPPVEVLDPRKIWVPNGEYYWGYTDRHVVVSPEHLDAVLNLLKPILAQPEMLIEKMQHRRDWNIEQYFKLHLTMHGFADRIDVFPYIMYLAAEETNVNSWTPGIYNSEAGHYVKYNGEFSRANFYSKILKTRSDWFTKNWKRIDRVPYGSENLSLAARIYNSLMFRVSRALKRN